MFSEYFVFLKILVVNKWFSEGRKASFFKVRIDAQSHTYIYYKLQSKHDKILKGGIIDILRKKIKLYKMLK